MYCTVLLDAKEGEDDDDKENNTSSISPPSHSIEPRVPCVVNAMPLASRCVVRMRTRDSIAHSLDIHSLCLSISHQCAYWELV